MYRHVLCLVILLVVYPFIRTFSDIYAEPFTIVIDAGHGGKDPGALGSIVREKDIVLDVALRFGRLINKNNPEVKVIYTRSTDVFIPLQVRPDIANKAKANLFVSIHSNYAENKSVRGASTYTLGQRRSDENFEIAKQENSVILLEENYKQHYEGFDPNSAESYIMFEFMQDTYMSQSIKFASTLQNIFSESGRYDKGVRQDVFLVLRNTTMPSALVELGFLTNRDEELFLNSNEGRDQLASCLYKAFKKFREDYERKSGVKQAYARDSESVTYTPNMETTNSTERKSQNEDSLIKSLERNNQAKYSLKKTSYESLKIKKDTIQNIKGIVFKVQLILSPDPIPTNDRRYKGIEMDYYFEKGNYKYTYGSWTNYSDADKKRKELSLKFYDAFVIAFKNGQRIPLNDARRELSQ